VKNAQMQKYQNCTKKKKRRKRKKKKTPLITQTLICEVLRWRLWSSSGI
jgi:hypothetical protein